MPAFAACVELPAGFSNAGAGSSHSPQTLMSSAVCQWSPGTFAAWFGACGAPLPELSLLPRVRMTATIPRMTTTAMATFQPNDPLRRRFGLRYLDRMAARWFRVGDWGRATGRLPAAPRPIGARAQRPRRHLHQRPRRQQQRRREEQDASGTPPATAREPVGRAVVLDDHPVRMGCGARALDVERVTPRLVRDAPTEPAEPPAQVDVLQVHEVPLVPAAHRIDRRPPEEQERARHPADVTRARPVDVELAVPAGEAVAWPDRPEQ